MAVVKMDHAKQNIEEDETYERELRNHRIRRYGFIIAIVAVVLIAIMVASFWQRKTSYDTYEVEHSMRRSDNGFAEYICQDGHLLRCSKDGVVAYDANGNVLWNNSYEVSNLMIATGGAYFAIADVNGNDVHLYHTEKGAVGSVNSALPILSVSVSENGYAAVLVEENGVDYIHLYGLENSQGKIYTIKKSIRVDGLPLCMAVSPDGQKLVTAYTGVTGGSIHTRLVFSNFDEVGQNENERVVGGYDYKDNLVGKIEFLSSNMVMALAEHSIGFYRFKEYPEELSRVKIDYEIDSVFTSADRVGLLHTDAESGDRILEVFHTSGTKEISVKLEYEDFDTFRFAETGVLMYGSERCVILNHKGEKIFDFVFEDGIVELFPIGKKPEFLYLNGEFIQKIRLK